MMCGTYEALPPRKSFRVSPFVPFHRKEYNVLTCTSVEECSLVLVPAKIVNLNTELLNQIGLDQHCPTEIEYKPQM